MAALAKTVLVLHGYSQNASIFSKRLGALRKECAKDGVELVFIDAPHVLQPADLVGSSPQTQTPELALQALGASEAASDPALTPRAWWKPNPERTKGVGLEESLAVVRDVLKTRKFDGVFGFSQGAAFAAIIAALLERPQLYPSFLVDGESPHPPLQFCVAVSGFKLVDPITAPVFTPSYSTPTLHVIGKTDIIVVEERSHRLVEVSSNRRVEEHEGGHFVPSKTNWRRFFCDYMKDPQANLAAPSVVGSSASNSGTSTPAGSSSSGSALMMKL